MTSARLLENLTSVFAMAAIGDDGHTIADLETALSMSKTAVRRYVDRLLDDEMVKQVAGSAAGGGRGRQPDRYVWTHRLRFLANFLS